MWNAYIWPLMTVRTEELRPIMVGLQYFFQLDTKWGEIMAYLSVVTIPVLIFYLALQRGPSSRASPHRGSRAKATPPRSPRRVGGMDCPAIKRNPS